MAQDADFGLTDSVEDAAWGPLQLEGLVDVESYAAIVFAREVRFLHESIQEMRQRQEDPRRDFRRLERMQRRFLDNLQAHQELNGVWSCARYYTQLAEINLLVRRDFAVAYDQILGGDGGVEAAHGAAIEREPDSPLGEECSGFFCLMALEQPKKAGSHWKKARAVDADWRLPAYMLAQVRVANPDLAARYGEAGK
jgi:hypothetical protein